MEDVTKLKERRSKLEKDLKAVETTYAQMIGQKVLLDELIGDKVEEQKVGK